MHPTHELLAAIAAVLFCSLPLWLMFWLGSKNSELAEQRRLVLDLDVIDQTADVMEEKS